MKKRPRVFLLVALGALVCVPAGLAIAQAAEDDGPSIEETREDPDPVTDPVKEMEALNRAHELGDAEAEAEAVDAVREEILSRLPQEDREAAEAAPDEAGVPPGTLSYIPDSAPPAVIEQCQDRVKESEDQLCELILLHDEGKIRAGAFSVAQQENALEEAQ